MAAYQFKPIPELPQAAIEYFWARIARRGPEECWPWLAGKWKRGYGKLTLENTCFKAHRVAFKLAFGEDPGDLLVCHSCDNPPCCNPRHLRKDTQQGNQEECTQKGRRPVGDKNGSRLHPETRPRGDDHPRRRRPELVLIRGENNPKAKLRWEDVEIIRKKFKEQRSSPQQLATDYHVNVSNIYAIIARRTWK